MMRLNFEFFIQRNIVRQRKNEYQEMQSFLHILIVFDSNIL